MSAANGKRITRVVVIEDHVAARRAISRVLAGEPGVEVVAAMSDGPAAVVRSGALRPDVVLLDAPAGADSATLRELRRDIPTSRVVLRGDGDWADEDLVRQELLPAIRGERARRRTAPPQPVPPAPPPPAPQPPAPAPARRAEPVRAIAIAASTGGPDALEAVLERFPLDLRVPVFVVQHMPAEFTGMLAARLDRRAAVPVREAVDGLRVEAGRVYVAPGGRHLAVDSGPEGPRLIVHDGPRENSCRPAADVLFRSAAAVYGSRLVAAVLTGMGRDGLAGARAVRDAGGRVVVQSEQSAVIASMPGAVAREGLADAVVDLGDLGRHLSALAVREEAR